MGDDTAGPGIVLATHDRVLGEALAIACRRHGLTIHLVERPEDVTGEHHPRVVELDAMDPGMSVRAFVAAALDGAGPSARPASTQAELDRLTGRERQVCRELLDGRGSAEIAVNLAISEHTVRTHLQNIFAKIGARDRAELVAWALGAGLDSGGERR